MTTHHGQWHRMHDTRVTMLSDDEKVASLEIVGQHGQINC
jgi:hypothetical protein